MDSQIAEWRRQFSRPAASLVSTTRPVAEAADHPANIAAEPLGDQLLKEIADERKKNVAVGAELVNLREELRKSARSLNVATDQIGRLVSTVDELKALVLNQQVELQDTKRRIDAAERLLVTRSKLEASSTFSTGGATTNGVHLSVPELFSLISSRESSGGAGDGGKVCTELKERVMVLEHQLKAERSEHEVALRSAVANAVDQTKLGLRAGTTRSPAPGNIPLRADDIHLFDERDLCFDDVLDEINNFGNIRTAVAASDAAFTSRLNQEAAILLAEKQRKDEEAAERLKREKALEAERRRLHDEALERQRLEDLAETRRQEEAAEQRRKLQAAEAERRDRELVVETRRREEELLRLKEQAAAEEKRRKDASDAAERRLAELETAVAAKRKQEAAEEALRCELEAKRQLEAAAAREKPQPEATTRLQVAGEVDALHVSGDELNEDLEEEEEEEEGEGGSDFGEVQNPPLNPPCWEEDSQGGVDPSRLDEIGLEPPPPIARELLPHRSLSTQSNRSSDSSDGAFQLRPVAKRSGTQRPKPLVLQQRHDDDDFDF